MKRKGSTIFLVVFVSLFFAIFTYPVRASMQDYCITPPFVSNYIEPNILLILDNSGSMNSFAYKEVEGERCNNYIAWTGYDENKKYYGLFDPDKIYQYDNSSSSHYFYEVGTAVDDPATAAILERAVPSGVVAFSGNWLNWWTMRRFDVAKKVLTGGRVTSATTDPNDYVLIGNPNERPLDYRRIFNDCIAGQTSNGCVNGVATKNVYYTPFRQGIYSYWLPDNGGRRTTATDPTGDFITAFNIVPASFDQSSDMTGATCVDVNYPTITNDPTYGNVGESLSSDAYYVAVKVGDRANPNDAPAGIVQNMGSKVRFGYMQFNYGLGPSEGCPGSLPANWDIDDDGNPDVQWGCADGGRVRNYVGDNIQNIVDAINGQMIKMMTPLEEVLNEAARYFRQDDPCYTPDYPDTPPNNAVDFEVSNQWDPYWFNNLNGGAGGFVPCAKSFTILVSDGAGNNNSGVNACGSVNQSFTGDDSGYLDDIAFGMHTIDQRSSGPQQLAGTQTVALYTVFTFDQSASARAALQYAAFAGGFVDRDGDGEPYYDGSGGTPFDPGTCGGASPDPGCKEWDDNDDGIPDNYFEAQDGYQMETSITAAILNIIRRTTSGTAASILASSEGTGANIVQAVYYPERIVGIDVIQWSGMVQNLWYYIDPFFTNASVREETTSDIPFPTLNLTNDYIAQFFFDYTQNKTRVNRYVDSDGDGAPDFQTTTKDFEQLGNIWEAGMILWSRDVTTDPRTIYTPLITGGSEVASTGLMYFKDAGNTNTSTLQPYLQAANTGEAQKIIDFVHGEDVSNFCSVTTGTNCTTDSDCPGGETCVSYRSRTVSIDLDGSGTIDAGETNVWKLSDAINSTPVTSSWVALNNYDEVYHDSTYFDQSNAVDSFLESPDYTDRGTVFSGANDGMLHAFNLGKLEQTWSGKGAPEKARLTGVELGKEKWALIPTNALPYLKYIADQNYCHLYTVDLSSYAFDASIEKPAGCVAGTNYRDCDRTVDSWRTILIGGMGFGGACKGTTVVCSDVSGDGSKDCVNTPVDVGGESVGYSTYFAIDVTDQNSPQLLWEFSHPDLGFSTSGPSVVRIATKQGDTNLDGVIDGDDYPDKDTNGRWLVVFGSGPTGPIDTIERQFIGRSDQNLKLFVLDLIGPSGPPGPLGGSTWVQNTDYWIKDTGINYAFAGTIVDTTIDPDLDYQDDAIHVGYSKRTGSAPNYTWTDGGIGRLVTKENLDPSNWAWSTVMDGIGPITSAVANILNTKTHELWLFASTGRFYYRQTANIDDPDSQRTLFGIKEPCYTGDLVKNCTTTEVFGSLTPATNNASLNPSAIPVGWYIDLELSGSYTYDEGGTPIARNYSAERSITSPLTATSGLVAFTTFKPSSDVCSFGGKTFIWGVNYSTGGVGDFKGKAIVQVSTGSIEQIDLSSAFTDKLGRRTAAIEGIPPTSQGMALLSPPKPVKRVIHMREQ